MKYKEDGKKELSVSLYSLLPETIHTQHAKEASELQSDVRIDNQLFFMLTSLNYAADVSVLVSCR